MTLRDLRVKNGYSQEELARMLKTTQSTVNRYERGARRPSPELAMKIAKVFNISIEDIWRMFYDKELKEA